MPRKGGGRRSKEKRRGGGGLHQSGKAGKGIKGGHQKRTSSGFSIRRPGKKLNLSQWSNSEQSRPAGGQVRRKGSPTKRRRERGALADSFVRRPKALSPNAQVEFKPSVLKFDPFQVADRTTAVVQDLQEKNLQAFEQQFGASDKADRKRRRDNERRAVASKQKEAVAALTRDNIYAVLEDTGASIAQAQQHSSPTADPQVQDWDSLFAESSTSLSFKPTQEAAAAAAAAAKAEADAKAAAAAQESAELGGNAAPTTEADDAGSNLASTLSIPTSLTTNVAFPSNSMLAQQGELEAASAAEHTQLQIDGSPTPSANPDNVADVSEVDIQENQSTGSIEATTEPTTSVNPLTKVENRWPSIAIGGPSRNSNPSSPAHSPQKGFDAAVQRALAEIEDDDDL